MTGFLECEEDGKRKLYYKSPLLTSPESKINWSELIEETKTLYERTGLKYLVNTSGAVVAVLKLLTRLTGTTLSWVREQREQQK